jgi:hypothetical protein
MSKRTDLETGAEARLHDNRTIDLIDQMPLIDWDARHAPPNRPLTLDMAKDAAAEHAFRQAVRQLVRSRSYDAIRELLDEELEGPKPKDQEAS